MRQYRFTVSRQNILVTLLFIIGIALFAVIGAVILLVVLSLAAVYLFASIIYRSILSKKSYKSPTQVTTKNSTYVRSLPYSDYIVEGDEKKKNSKPNN